MHAKKKRRSSNMNEWIYYQNTICENKKVNKKGRGTVVEKGDNAKIAVKIIDDRGIESLRVISL